MSDRTRGWIARWVIGDLSWRRMLTSIVFIYGCLCLAGIVLPDKLLFLPHPAGYADADVIKLTTRTGARISARYAPARAPNGATKDPTKSAPSGYVVLASHGNAEDMADSDWFVDRMNARGLSVLTYDYEGYGTSSGKPSERALYDDIDAAYEHLTAVLHYPPEHVIVYGRSLGGGPSVDLASRARVGGLILESTFMSAFRVPFRIRILPWDKFESLSKMHLVSCPVLVVHGDADRLISIAHGRALFDAAPGPKRALWVPGAGHTDLPWVAGESYDKAIGDFVSELVVAR